MEPKVGFFARLFRKRKARPIAVLESEPSRSRSQRSSPSVRGARGARAGIPRASPRAVVADLAAELASVEAQMAEETTELLTCVLDRLGAAHHRPFSRG